MFGGQEAESRATSSPPNTGEAIIVAQAVPVSPALAKPRVWTVFVAMFVVVIAIFVLQIGALVPFAVWHLQQGVTPQRLGAELVASLSHPAAFIGLAALGQVAMGGTALLAAWLSPVPLRQRLGFVPSAWSLGETAIVLLGTLVPFAIGISSAYALAEVITPDPSVKKMYESMTVAWAAPFVLFIALGPGFCEEMLFRGYMQTRLLARFPPWIALSITAVIFGLFHVMPHAIAAAFPIGIWLGLMAWRSGSIWPGIACHALVNGLWNVRSMGVRFEVFPARPPLALLIALGIVGVIAFGWSLRILFGRRETEATDTPATGALRAL